MEMEVITDEKLTDREALAAYFRTAVARELKPVGGHINKVELHLGDENGNRRGGDSKRCMIVAHLEGHLPMSVTQHGTTLGAAVDGACDRLFGMIENSMGLLREESQESRHSYDALPQ